MHSVIKDIKPKLYFIRETYQKYKKVCCYYCDFEFPENQLGQEAIVLDRIIPESKGGSYSLNNIVISCQSCKSAKRKSNPFGSAALEHFKKERTLFHKQKQKQVKDNIWNQVNFKKSPENDKLRNELTNLLIEKKIFKKVLNVGKSQVVIIHNKLKFRYSVNGYFLWVEGMKAHTDTCRHFKKNKFIETELNALLELDLMGYSQSASYREKYCKSFDNAEDGSRIIIKDIRLLNKWIMSQPWLCKRLEIEDI